MIFKHGIEIFELKHAQSSEKGASAPGKRLVKDLQKLCKWKKGVLG
jgi:hypothetical protein